MHVTEQRHAGHRAEQHADQHRHKRQQHAPAAKRQQQQQQNADRRATADPSHLASSLLLAVGGIEQATGGEQLHAALRRLLAAVLEQLCHLQRQVHVESIAGGARTQHHPALAVGLGDQCAAANVQLHCAMFRLAVLDAPGQAQPVVLARHQGEAVERIEQRLHPLLDERVGVLAE